MGENELAEVNNLANIAMMNAIAIANAVMQHPDPPQDSVSVSSEARAFYRAQGPSITLELPLPAVGAEKISADRTLAISRQNIQSFDSDNQIREMANNLGLHQVFGPFPSVEMLLHEMALLARENQRFLPMKNPMPPNSWNFWPVNPSMDTWFLNMGNPHWGNNAEATTSSRYKRPRLE